MFDKRASKYIAEYKKVDYKRDNNMENINDTAKALMIDIRFSSPPLFNQESVNIDIFITSFRTINSAKRMIINFLNHFFDFAITGSSQD